MATKELVKSPISLQDLLLAYENDRLTKPDFMEAFDQVIKVVKDSKSLNAREFQAIQSAFEVFKTNTLKDLSDNHESFKADARNQLQTLFMQHGVKMSEIDQRLLELKDGDPGKDANEDAILNRILEQIKLPEQKETLLDTPEDIRNKLELLQGEERLDAAAIRNLPELIKKNKSLQGVLTASALFSLADVNVAGITVGQSIKWDGTQWIPYTPSGSGGSGYQAPLSGGLTGTNTWTTAPNVLVIDNVPYQKTQTDGTVMWTGTTTTVLTGAQLPTRDIYAAS